MKSKLTLDDIKAAVVRTDYYIFPDTTLTVACLHLVNGYTVTGESACVDPANFNKELGEKYAYEAGLSKIWSLEGYLLKDQHHKSKPNMFDDSDSYQRLGEGSSV